MRPTSPPVLALALLVLALATAFVAACGPAAGPGKWEDHKGDIPFAVGDYETGLQLARTTGRPPAYYFTTTW